MNQEQIIELAREVADKDKEDPVSHDGLITLTYEEMERFTAAVIKAHEAKPQAQVQVERPCHLFNVKKAGSLTEWEPTTMAFALPDGIHALYTHPAPVQAQSEPVLEVIAEPDHWHNGHWYEDTGRSYISESAIQKLPIGTKLYAAPVQQDQIELEADYQAKCNELELIHEVNDKRIAELEAEIAATEKQVEILTDMLAESRKQNKQLLEALKELLEEVEGCGAGSEKQARAAIAQVTPQEQIVKKQPVSAADLTPPEQDIEGYPV